ncbi:uncharacterized protein LOC126747409 isoform X2 [Anthonomus grandis grandis]|uniref:uncharacterized protein LOC126747409 isoform X2 n=1 Tax=Anthonomus grandis grandis TaxID=2921223 RepID=UPI0021660346|nr:uncharacterized protein LOC126747409 isoform X2 [Anthonomus grandis grandis]
MRSLFLLCGITVLVVLINCEKKIKNEVGALETPPKKFIGRIEHGKVKVLRSKQPNEEFCNKKGQSCQKTEEEEDGDSSEEPKRQKIKYSIKFRHEKQKKSEKNNGDMNIMRLHKNSRKKYGKRDYYDDDDSSEEEDDSPIKKRFREMDDDD